MTEWFSSIIPVFQHSIIPDLIFKPVFFPPGFYLGHYALRELDLRGLDFPFEWDGCVEDDP